VNTKPSRIPQPSQKDAGFDQSFLRELIKDYGEFDSYSNLAATPEPSEEIKAEAKTTAVARSQEELDSQERPESPARAANFEQEVKNLIQTYGKVDIYSTRTDRKRIVKNTLVMGAVLLIVLIVSYFLLFKETPKEGMPQSRSELPSLPAEEKNSLSASRPNLGEPAKEASLIR
jgi:hypothetical protein